MRVIDGWAGRQGRSRLRLLWAAAAACLVGAPAASAAVFDERGFNRNRDYFTQLPFEHIDPMTGNLLLTHTDLVLPGNAGFDLRVQRTYNSKIYRDYNTGQTALDEDSWAGVGWTLHFGRVFHSTSTDPANPVVEMPDGSRHPMFRKIGLGSDFISRDYWIYNRDTGTLKLPNGIVYTFGRGTSIGGVPVAYATKIEDPFGNEIRVSYATDSTDAITSVVHDLGTGGQRTIIFAREATFGGLRTMTYSGSQTHTWTYTHQTAGSPGFSVLTEARPPVGQSWRYQYNTATAPRWELIGVTTPHGGQIDFTYAEFQSRLGSQAVQRSHGVSVRTTSGRDIVGGRWEYRYAQGSLRNQTTITGPCSTETLTFLGVGNESPGSVWEIGLLARRTVTDGTGVLQSEDLAWLRGEPVSTEHQIVGSNQDTAIYVPLVRSRTVTRNGRTFTTTNTYNTTDFNDYGRPHRVAEDGDLVRTIVRAFDYGFSLYIKDRIASETVTALGESFVRSYGYDSQGFMTSETVYGLTKTYDSTTGGNVGSISDGRNTTSFSNYAWGNARTIATPEFTITRAIDPEGTMASETRRGITSSFDYDTLFRPTRATPGAGNPTVTAWDNTGDLESFTVNRGSSSTRTDLDGFGRPSATENGVGVKTDLRYDACGRRSYESYPFQGASNIGSTYTFDGLDRVRSKSNPDGTTVTHAYSNGGTGINVSITNERGKTTIQKWQAFGNPAEARLAAVTDTDGKLWSYDYNTVGSLTQVTAPGGVQRQWAYLRSFGGLLASEREPEHENRLVTYDYYENGALRARTDPQFGTTTYTIDGNDRPTLIDRPGTAYDTTVGYDASDNRVLLQNAYVRSEFAYDNGNRLISRTDRIGTQTITTGYLPDGNDNLARIDYHSGLSVRYSYDAANRITAAFREGAGCPGAACYANGVTYHASGAMTSFTAGNGRAHTMAYDANRYWIRSVNAGGLLTLNYDNYDGVGNVGTITDARGAAFNQQYGYDNLDRMTTANGVWGAAAFSYDARGNRTGKSLPGCSTTYTYGTERLASATGCELDTFTYDTNGNLRTQAGRSYTYTPENMMETAVVSGATTTYRYDGDNLRKVRDLGGSKYLYVHGPGGQLLSEYSEPCAGRIERVRDYVYLGTRLLAAVRPLAGPTTVALAAGSSSVNESAGVVRSDIRVQTGNGQPTACAISVPYATVNGTAVSPADYTGAAPGATVTFPAGTPHNTVQSVNVAIAGDSLDESDETFSFGLTGISGAILGSPASTLVTIVDDDPTPVVSTTNVTVGPEGASGSQTQAVFNVSLSAVSGRDVTVEVATADVNAAAGQDYLPVARILPPLSIPAGTQGVAVPVTVLGDALDEDDEQFAVRLSNAINATIGGSGEWRGTIVDDDPLPVITTQDNTVTEGSSQTTPMTFPLFLSAPSGRRVWVRFRTEDITARTPGDYQGVDAAQLFEPGQTQINVPVSVVGDRVYEPGVPETFWAKLELPLSATVGTPPRPGGWQGAIVDDDPAPTVSAADCSRVEGDAGTVPCSFAVNLSNPSSQEIRVSYATTGQTATSGTDFQAAQGTLVFEPETSGRTVEVPLIGDVTPEINETILFDLSNPSNVTIAGGQARGTIIDDEPMTFHPVAPCRVLDTRGSGPGALSCDGTKRAVPIGGTCGTVPMTAKAAAVNVTTVQQTQAGNLRLYPAGLPVPGTSVLNFVANVARANNGTVLLGTEGRATVQCDMAAPGGSTHVLVDVFGYYE